MNEDLTKLLTIFLVFIIGMVSAGAVILTTDNDSDNDGDSDDDPIIPEPVNQLPVASMFTSSITAFPYEEITLDASSSTDPDGSIVSYTFDFGDDTDPLTQEGAVTTHVYKDTGEYYVDLEVTDDNGTVSENGMEIMILVEEEIPQEVISTSSRSIDDFDVAYETVDDSPLAEPPEQENPVGEEEEHPAPEIPLPEVNYSAVAEDPEYPELDTLEIDDPEMDLEFGDLADSNAGYEAAMDWEDAEDEFVATMDGAEGEDEGLEDLDADPVTAFQEDFGAFEHHQDSNDTGKHFSYRSIQIVNVSVHDADDDGNPESSHTQTMSYEAIGDEVNPTYESFYSSEVTLFDNNSDGFHNYLRINQFGFESVDADGDGIAEYSLISIRVIMVYDNNSDGNPEYAHAFEVTYVSVDRNDDGHAGFQAAYFRDLKIWDENSDGNFRLFSAFEWGAFSRDGNNDTNNEYGAISAKKLVMFDNTSDGKPNYAQYRHFGIASRDRNSDGENDLIITAYEGWTVRDNHNSTSDGNPELIRGTRAYLRHNANRNTTVATFETLVMFDNSSDGVHNHMHFTKVAWISVDARDGNGNLTAGGDGNPELEALKFEDFVVYRNDTSKENLSFVSIWRLTAVRRDTNSDGEADSHLFKVEGYVMEDDDQDGIPEVTWHIEYVGDGEEEEP